MVGFRRCVHKALSYRGRGAPAARDARGEAARAAGSSERESRNVEALYISLRRTVRRPEVLAQQLFFAPKVASAASYDVPPWMRS